MGDEGASRLVAVALEYQAACRSLAWTLDAGTEAWTL